MLYMAFPEDWLDEAIGPSFSVAVQLLFWFNVLLQSLVVSVKYDGLFPRLRLLIVAGACPTLLIVIVWEVDDLLSPIVLIVGLTGQPHIKLRLTY
jgi:hypothetical protein